MLGFRGLKLRRSRLLHLRPRPSPHGWPGRIESRAAMYIVGTRASVPRLFLRRCPNPLPKLQKPLNRRRRHPKPPLSRRCQPTTDRRSSRRI